MEDKNLKFKIIFKLGQNDSTAYARSLFKSFFCSCHEGKNFHCVIRDTDCMQIIEDLVYEKPVYEIDYTLDFRNNSTSPDLQSFEKEICKNWCGQESKLVYQLLMPVREGLHGKLKQFHTDVKTLEFAFGTLPDFKHFVSHFHYKHDPSVPEIMTSYYHSKRFFNLYFCLTHEKQCEHPKTTHRFEVQYLSIVRVVVDFAQVKTSERRLNIYLHLTHLPPVYMKIRPQNKDADNKSNNASQNSTPDILTSDQAYQQSKWERTLDFGCQCKNSACPVEKVGKALILKLVIQDNDRGHDIIQRLKQRCPRNTNFFYHPVKTVYYHRLHNFDSFSFLTRYERTPQWSDKNYQRSLFSCQYAWEALVSKSFDIHDQIYLVECQQNPDYWDHLQNRMKRAQDNPHALATALFHIYNMLYTKNMVFDFGSSFDELFQYFREHKQIVDLPSGMCLARRLIITPSRRILLPPMEHFDNRVVREFGIEYMLRISIQDENSNKLTFAVPPSGKKVFLERTVGHLLRQGIKIGNRLYEVLASSNSQLREHGLWMWASDDKHHRASYVRDWMGDFSSIHNVAKYMARMGQCFTTSEEAAQVAVDAEDEIDLKEIRTKDKKYTFSDGIGMISPDLAKQARETLESKMDIILLANEIYKPSAFQIRYKGCKGMVAEMPFCDGTALGIRPSMRKFECDSSCNLEIVKTSAPRALFLNRPLITILEQLGVCERVFLKLQKSAILDLTDSLLYENKAAKIMTNMLLLDFPFKKLQKAGIILTEEPFFRVLLLAVYKSAVDHLRSKARIPVPPEYGRNMLGILDETRTLKYGEVFVQYSENVGNTTSPLHILKGTVVVTKNPCMHPGDVRMLQAVDVKLLHHIKDCIVFPAEGHRPHPDEMAGSDLDGDEYVVIWMPELMFPKNYDPMEYPSSELKNLGRDIEVDDMVNFFCDYIQNDNIGTFANAHLSWADSEKEGIFSRVCMSISSKYPYVLDFAKTGHTKHLESSEKARSYPDFMEKGVSSNNYRSRRTLGTLYRTSRVLEACIGKIDLKTYTSKIDPYLLYPGWEKYEEWAKNLYHDYTNRVSSMLNKYGIQSETEALSSYVEKVILFSQNRNEKANVVSIVKTYIVATMVRFKYKFLNEVDNDCRNCNLSEVEKKDIRFQRASAWYMVVYQQKSPSILSFPWILSDILIEIRNKNLEIAGGHPVTSGSSFLDMLDQNLKPLSTMVDDFCSCVTIGKNVLFEWMSKSNLNYASVCNEACIDCVTRVFNYFMQSTETNCCGGKEWECACVAKCSPAKFVMAYLKFFVSNISSQLGDCSSCEGFRPFNLCTLALQTYADLAISHDKKYLGFEQGDSVALHDSTLDEEGDPIRIPVIDSELEKLMTHHMAEVKTLLKEMSGVKEIFISGNKDRSGQWFILVNSVGRCWQRWNLEELIMSPVLSIHLRHKIDSLQQNRRS